MISIIWVTLISIGIIYSILFGNVEIINNTILNSGNEVFNLMIKTMPIVVLWTGIINIANDAGLLNKFANILNPFLSKIFPSISKNNVALGYISSNMAANMLGLGSAATPFGLKAMEELQKINNKKDTATDAMITFLVLNTAGVTIIPTSIIALRLAYNSSNPTEILLPCILATFFSFLFAISIDYLVRRKH